MNIKYSAFIIPALAMGLFAFPAFANNEPMPSQSQCSVQKVKQNVPNFERRTQGTLVIEGVPEIPAELSDRMLQYLSTRSASACDWSQDGKYLFIFTRLGETSQVHRIAFPGACREQLTFFKEPVNQAAVNPDPSKHVFLLLKDVGGNENYQIYSFNTDNGQYKMLSNGKSRYGTLVWDPKGERFAYQSTERNGTDWDIWVSTVDNPQPKMVFSENGHWSVNDWSSDGKHLLISKYVSITDSELACLDIETGKVQYLGGKAKNEKVSLGEACFSKDGKKVFFTSDKGGEFRNLCVQDLQSGKISLLTPNLDWDVELLAPSKDGKTLAFTANEKGIGTVYLMDLNSKDYKYRQVKGLPVGTVGTVKFNPDSTELAISINGSTTPGDVFAANIKDGKITRWTNSEVGGLNPNNFVEPDLIYFDTFDKDKSTGKARQIPAFCYRPKNVKGPVPVLINIHGGPESQFQPYFSSLNQYLVNELGIAVIAPNVRGSSGYGKTYVQLDNGYLREDSVKDIGSLLDWIAKHPEFDSSRVAVMGGSYGGYMTLASMTHYNDRLACGVDNVGISNFVTFLKNTQDYRRDLRRAEYGDERDPKMFNFMQKIAPANNAGKITKPMFVIQGKNDPRVPVTEAEQMVKEIRQNGGSVWYLMAEDEGHGFRKKTNRDYYLQSVVMFLKKHLVK